MQYPGNHHPHFGIVPELPHSHDYLLTYFQSHTAPAAPPVAGSLAALLEHLGAAPSRAIATAAELHPGWKSPVGRLPPRA